MIFIDDDNVVASNYLEQALKIAMEFPLMGVWGGSIKGIFEKKMPSNFESRLSLLAVGEIRQDAWGTIKGYNEACPIGAGMVVRKSIAEKYRDITESENSRLALGRKGNNLTSGEDVDIAWFACDNGYGMGRFKNLQLDHLISKNRVNLDYCERIIEGFHYSNIFLFNYHNMPLTYINKTIWSKLRSIKQFLQSSAEERRLTMAAWRGTKKGIYDFKIQKNKK